MAIRIMEDSGLMCKSVIVVDFVTIVLKDEIWPKVNDLFIVEAVIDVVVGSVVIVEVVLKRLTGETKESSLCDD